MADVNAGQIIRQINNHTDRVAKELASMVDSVGTEVGQSRLDLQLTRDELKELRQEFDEYVKQAERTAAIQESSVKVVNLKAQLDREFGHYQRVRHSSIGILQAFDVGNVSNDTVRAVGEELMIQTPRYWLAPAVVALAAWSRDDQTIAEKSVGEAFARDRNKTSLFFALVLRRQGRLDGSVRWLRHYLTSLDPSNLTREFAIILEATSYDAFGPAGQQLLADVMLDWAKTLRDSPEIIEKQIKAWVREIGMNREQVASDAYPTLSRICPAWPDVARQLEQASALPVVIEKYEAVRAFDAPIPTVLEDMLDDILEPLVTEYDEEELPLRREVVYHEAVVEERGDIDRARDRADLLQKALENTTDIVSLQTQAAISPDLLGVSTGTQRIAIGVGHTDFISAVGRFCAAYRANAMSGVDLVFDGRHSNFATSYNFIGLTLYINLPEDQGIARLEAAWAKTLETYISALRFDNRWYLKPGIITAVVAAFGFFFSFWFGLILLLGGLGITYYNGNEAKRKCDQAIRAVEQQRQQAIAYSLAMYRDASAEWVDARLLYEELDSQEADLLTLVETWPTNPSQEPVMV